MFAKIYEEDYLDFYDPSECLGDLDEKWCSFKWHIYNIQLNPNERLRSPTFATRLLSDNHWYLEVELLSPGDLKTMKISLNRVGNLNKTDLMLDVIFKIICNEKIEVSDKKIISFYFDQLEDDEEISNEQSRHDADTFSASFYKSKKNHLIVECKLRPNKKMIRRMFNFYVYKNLPIHLRSLLQTGELFDTIIRVGDNRLAAHIAILYARLPHLLEKCLAPFKEEGKYFINIIDLPISVVKEMLKYAYTGHAYVDSESLSIDKDVIISYSQDFWKSCCWDDHPFAETFFNYETDTLSWYLKDVHTKSNLGSQNVDLLRIFHGKFTFSLDVDESEKDKKWLMLTFEFLTDVARYNRRYDSLKQGNHTRLNLSDEIPKPTIVSCSTFLVNRESGETLEFGTTETLLRSNKTKGELKLCSLLEVQKGKDTFHTTVDSLILQTDLKFCYGSYKSSIENMYEEQFDISRCNSCHQLQTEMKALHISQKYWNITVVSEDGCKFYAHKAILLARWPDADKFEAIKNNQVIEVKSKADALQKFLLWLYTGTSLYGKYGSLKFVSEI